MIKKVKAFMCLIILFSFSVTVQAQVEGAVTIETLLKDMVNRDRLAQFPKQNFRLKQHSSYNRKSVKLEAATKKTTGWFKNKDNNTTEKDSNFIRIENNSKREKEWVLMDHQAPGALVRTWMPFRLENSPETDIILRVYLDGATEPTLEGNMLEIFNGTGLFSYPFAHKSLRSAVSFFPIPYAKSCKITTSDIPFFFQFTFREYIESVNIKTFTLSDFNKAKKLTKKVGCTLLDPKNTESGKWLKLKKVIQPNEEKGIELPSGANAAIRELSVALDNYNDPEITRKVILKIEFDGKETVWCPVGDFFGSGIGLNPVQGWNTSVSETGLMSALWVMPYQESGKISIINLSDAPISVNLNASVGKWKWNGDSLYFNAAWKGQYPVPTRPFSDWNYITLGGRGVYVGDALTVMNPTKVWWGEGDEKIWVDNEDFPSIFGTGTEDYYGYSWGGRSTEFYEHPFHAQPKAYKYNKLNPKQNLKEGITAGYSTESRVRALDIMPFESALKLDMEVWAWKECEMGYGVGVYWYGDATTTSNATQDRKEILNVPPLPEAYFGNKE
jgi:hypothetical protein